MLMGSYEKERVEKSTHLMVEGTTLCLKHIILKIQRKALEEN